MSVGEWMGFPQNAMPFDARGFLTRCSQRTEGGDGESGKVFLAPPGFMLTLQCDMHYSGAARVGSNGP